MHHMLFLLMLAVNEGTPGNIFLLTQTEIAAARNVIKDIPRIWWCHG